MFIPTEVFLSKIHTYISGVTEEITQGARQGRLPCSLNWPMCTCGKNQPGSLLCGARVMWPTTPRFPCIIWCPCTSYTQGNIHYPALKGDEHACQSSPYWQLSVGHHPGRLLPLLVILHTFIPVSYLTYIWESCLFTLAFSSTSSSQLVCSTQKASKNSSDFRQMQSDSCYHQFLDWMPTEIRKIHRIK